MAGNDGDVMFALAPLEASALVAARLDIARAESNAQVGEFSHELARYVGGHGDGELAEYERLAILGVCAGFAERQLSPYIAEHLEILAPLLAEIRAVYGELHKLGTPYDPAEFRIRAFHYGVHKASYLDWCLYLSKECY